MTYPHFFLANFTGALCWAAGTTAAVYYAGLAAGHWLNRFAWIALVIAVITGVVVMKTVKGRIRDHLPQDFPPGPH